MTKFLLNNIVYKYGVSHELISDKGSHFRKEVVALLKKYKIQHHKSSSYHPQANGAIEIANKNVKQIINKMARNYKD